MMRLFLRIGVVATVTCLGWIGCGPVESTSVILDAEAACAKARVEHADTVREAAYYYHASLQYLDKAREEQGYSDFEEAIDYARKAKNLAEKAKSIAVADQGHSE